MLFGLFKACEVAADAPEAGEFDGGGRPTRGAGGRDCGAVIDLAFGGKLPPIDDAVEIAEAGGRVIVAEIQAHLDAHRARAIALEPTTGVRRGDGAGPAGGPITIAVGEATLGRLFDVLGRVGDRGPPLPPNAPRWPIHRKPPPFSAQTGATKLFATGIKVIDLLAPLAQGGRPPCSAAPALARRCW